MDYAKPPNYNQTYQFEGCTDKRNWLLREKFFNKFSNGKRSFCNAVSENRNSQIVRTYIDKNKKIVKVNTKMNLKHKKIKHSCLIKTRRFNRTKTTCKKINWIYVPLLNVEMFRFWWRVKKLFFTKGAL